ALETADLQGESGPVDQQSDHNLRIDSTLFGIADLAQRILGFRFEIQGGHGVQNQRQSTAVRSVGEALLGDRVAVTAGVDLAGMAEPVKISVYAGGQR